MGPNDIDVTTSQYDVRRLVLREKNPLFFMDS
jgi:hypothetical protein